MTFIRLLSLLKTLLLRGVGSGVSVLFTVMVSRYLPTSEAASFFILFNASAIAAICFRWGVDEVIIRRVAAAHADDRNSIATILVLQAHRRVLLWASATILIGFVLYLPWGKRHIGDFAFIDFVLTVIASALIACAAAATRVLQAEGGINAATLYLNIWVPSLALFGLLALELFGEAAGARQLLFCYLMAAVTMYAVVVPLRYGRDIINRFLIRRRGCHADDADIVAANRLGVVVLAQQVLGWSAVLIIPIFYGNLAYAGFVVSQKIATLISLLMLAINFTFSSQFAELHSQGRLREIWSLVRLSCVAILAASAVILVAAWHFIDLILDYAHIPQRFGHVVLILMIGQVAFSMAALFSLVLSMCRLEHFLLRVQLITALVSVGAFLGASSVVPLAGAALVVVASYSILACLLYLKVRSITLEGVKPP